nr:hypothetical protein [Prevotella intermedia]
MHGKSGCFALQNSRFRNAKSKLLFFKEIIFTKSRLLLSLLLELLEKSRKTRNSTQHPYKNNTTAPHKPSNAYAPPFK